MVEYVKGVGGRTDHEESPGSVVEEDGGGDDEHCQADKLVELIAGIFGLAWEILKMEGRGGTIVAKRRGTELFRRFEILEIKDAAGIDSEREMLVY